MIILLLSAGFVWVRPSRLPSVFMPSHGSFADPLAFRLQALSQHACSTEVLLRIHLNPAIGHSLPP